MAPFSSGDRPVVENSTYRTTYLTRTCTPTSFAFSCAQFATPVSFSGPMYTNKAIYMQAMRSTVTDGAIGLGPLEMVWKTTPYVALSFRVCRRLTLDSVSVLASWDTAIANAMPTDFNDLAQRVLATALPTSSDAIPNWLAQLPAEVYTYYASASLAKYTTPVQYFEFYESISPAPQTSGTSVVMDDGATAASTSDSTRDARPADTIVTPGQSAAIATSVIIVALAVLCGLVVYYKRIRPARDRALAKPNPSKEQHSIDHDTKGPDPVEPITLHLDADRLCKKTGPPAYTPTELLAPTHLPELECISPAAPSRKNASQHCRAELEGSAVASSGTGRFVIDGGVQLPPKVLDSDN
ncbi:hypothetical protein PRZ48_004720 [Zasmidium cellare]|uniref:Transmembrane protein n=1 Tax=Zasmidium cellare TaxID=395010 RepID=A0ABR0ERN6_ZASCE|nr:hypothetical protein PRZ48_004720 [Zasmidium cellare]